ncbi:MAG: choice-of-anchor L domain-containing protein [Flavobacteriales bacterium]|nr:choice-of-anchor L domain-containing protein [Flavobacteriales bacterium]
MKHFLSLSILVVLSILQVNAQIVIDNTLTVEEYVQNVLLGEGVVASNITFNGGPANINVTQVASFNSTNANVGIENGIFMASGGVTLAQGPNNSSGLTVDTGLGNFNGSDPDLIAISSGFGINDWCIIEFDFVPTGDSISFNYVWGSEEYMEWVNSPFNDIFGFFLSGPGINGTFSNDAINIALVPGTSLPVTIDNVNLNNNGSYYVDNGDGFTAPNSTDEFYIQFDGFTISLVAQAQVQCGQTYHIKLALADSGDSALDCGVFLEEGSFSSNALNIVGTVDNPPGFLPGNTVLEGCVDGFFTIFQPDINSADTLTLLIFGSANSGIDFQPIPIEVIIPEGSISIEIPIIPLYDGLVEGTESITIQYTYLNSCGEQDTAAATMFIADYLDMTLDLDDVFICPGENTQVNATPNGGAPTYSYDWSTGQSSANVSFNAEDLDDVLEVSVTVVDYCQNEVSASFLISEPAPFIVQDTVDFCLGLETGDLVTGGASPYIYTFDTLAFTYLGNDKFTALIPGTFYIEVQDQCGQEEDIFVEVVECDTFIPNVFTPSNSNNYNDTFVIQGIEGFPKSKLTVYNRWGNIVYENEKYDNKWRAEDIPGGTYFYIFNRSDGENYSGYVMIIQ